MSFRKVLLVGAVALCMSAVAAPAAASHTVTWEGHTWSHYAAGDVAVSEAGDLEVTPAGVYTAAYYGTSPAFRSDDGHSVVTTFEDQGLGTVGPQLWVERETSGPNGSWTQIGSFPSRGDNYWIIEWNPGTSSVIWHDTGVLRTAGSHTFEIGLPSGGGQYDYWVDGQFVYSSTGINPDYIGDVYLAAHTADDGETVTFTSYSENTDYAGVVGPPTSQDECKNGGWQTFNNPRFANQGQCVSSVASGGRSTQ